MLLHQISFNIRDAENKEKEKSLPSDLDIKKEIIDGMAKNFNVKLTTDSNLTDAKILYI
jgi:hypothetical protein